MLQLSTPQLKGGSTMMKVACAAIACVLVLFQSACVTGDEITTYVIEPDEAVSFYIYRSNLASDQTGEKGKEDLDSYMQKLEEKQADLFTRLAKANAKEVRVAVLRMTSPASVVIAGRIPTLTDLFVYLGEESECTAISRERTHVRDEEARSSVIGNLQLGTGQSLQLQSRRSGSLAPFDCSTKSRAFLTSSVFPFRTSVIAPSAPPSPPDAIGIAEAPLSISIARTSVTVIPVGQG